MKRALAAAALLAFAASALAEALALGSLELRACGQGRERATLVLEVSAPQLPRVRAELEECAAHGVATASLPALLKNLPGAEPAFWEEFQLCMRYTEWERAELRVEKSCRREP